MKRTKVGMFKKVFSRIAVVFVLTAFGGASAAWCDSLSLLSSGSGLYTYGLDVTSYSLSFGMGQTLTLSGLSGVTGASVSGILASSGWTVESFTSSSVTFVQSEFGLAGFQSGSQGVATFGAFTVDSSVLTLGTVEYSGQGYTSSSPTANLTPADLSGTVQGPVSTPEPSSLFLLIGGLATLGLVALRSRFA